MGMPQIPEGTNRPSIDELFIDLLESLALEQMSVSHLLNAQGELLQESIRKWNCDEIDLCELQCSCKNTNNLISDLIMKEWLMQKKLNSILEIGLYCSDCDNTDCTYSRPSFCKKESPPKL